MTQDLRTASPPAALDAQQDAPPSVQWSDAQLLLLALQQLFVCYLPQH